MLQKDRFEASLAVACNRIIPTKEGSSGRKDQAQRGTFKKKFYSSLFAVRTFCVVKKKKKKNNFPSLSHCHRGSHQNRKKQREIS